VFWLASSSVFFMSGAAGLAFQVIWFKRFAHVLGSSSLAFAAVGVTYLFGLGSGPTRKLRIDRIGAPLVQRMRTSHRTFGRCDLVRDFLVGYIVGWIL
jgi:hypothetical protein